MNLKRFDLYCSGHIAEDRDECEDGEYVDAADAIKEIDILKAQNAELLEALCCLLEALDMADKAIAKGETNE